MRLQIMHHNKKEIYMKKLTILPLFLVAPLLVGCGTNVKAPKFAKAGEEVSCEKFGTDLLEKKEAAAFSKEDKIGSLVWKNKSASKRTIKDVRADKLVVKDSVNYNELNVTMQYDASNYLIQGSQKAKSSTVEKTQYEDEKTEQNANVNMFIQEYAKNDKKYAIYGNKESKELHGAAELGESLTIADYVDGNMKNMLAQQGTTVVSIVVQYETLTDEEKAKYKFYENGNIFTVEYKSEKEDEHKDGEDVVIYKTKTSNYSKIQLDLTDGAWKLKMYQEDTIETEYVKDDEDYDHLAGEKIVDKRLSMADGEAKYKSVKLKAVDTAGYRDDILS